MTRVAALQSGAAAVQRAWCIRSGAVCPAILDAFKAGKP
jgi:TRAP-type transport system periplasmic protein